MNGRSYCALNVDTGETVYAGQSLHDAIMAFQPRVVIGQSYGANAGVEARRQAEWYVAHVRKHGG